MEKELIIFDCFGVITSEVYKVWLKKFFSEEEMDNITQNIMIKGDKGEITNEETFQRLGDMIGKTGEEVLSEWLKITQINEDVIELIKQLKKQYRVALLSNAPTDLINEVLSRIDTNVLFDNMIISSQVNMIKPNKEIYELLLSNMNVAPEKSIFIDDSIENVNAAKELGITGILFKNAEQLKKELSRLLEKLAV